ncbi:hypothetical protein AQUCO_00500205v1 [Aquilegia coerulea]|uniref:Uncharacterized protein n=1 Tax=Aquilegia coerulea TaxID=218851 RepID=A0A2G5EQT5_AQUCA|nr:hypothetical protein AQUCO_00500205v1 [Aquilegia coerulea]
MGKSLLFTTTTKLLHQLHTKFITTTHKLINNNQIPFYQNRNFTTKESYKLCNLDQLKFKMNNPDMQQQQQQQQQQQSSVPLSDVVSDCAKRWFQDTLKDAKAGDSSMQILVGQMYCNGYGVSRDSQKGRAWFTRASKHRSSVWKVTDKRPGYNASDSDSDDLDDKDAL